ncbi:MAG: hypothetical protein MJB12_19805, partial [Firmicutes bacterium]|nr:hypothetical protein [Bacillota bacterium]
TIDTLPEFGTLSYLDDDTGERVDITVDNIDSIGPLSQSEFDSLEYAADQDAVQEEAVSFLLGTEGTTGDISDWGTTPDDGYTYVTPLEGGSFYAIVSADDPNGDPAKVGFQNEPFDEKGVGIGVQGMNDGQIETRFQNGVWNTEVLELTFSTDPVSGEPVPVTNVSVVFSGLGDNYLPDAEENAHVHWVALDQDGNVVGEGYEDKPADSAEQYGEVVVDLVDPVTGDPLIFTTLQISVAGGGPDETGYGSATIKSFQVTTVVEDSFDYTVTDPMGESDSSTITFNLDDIVDRSELIVGSNSDDSGDSDAEFIVPGPDTETDTQGDIDGSGFDDMIAG